MPAADAGMEGVRVYSIELTMRARQPLGFGVQPGAQLRGALYNALAAQACPIDAPPHPRGSAGDCPVCWLLAQEDSTQNRGRDVPRPLIIQPPLGLTDLRAGEQLVFGLKLVGDRAAAALPLIVRAAEQAAADGFGHGRGAASLERVRALRPEGDFVELSAPQALTTSNLFALGSASVARRMRQLDRRRVRVRFLTPVTLTERGQTLHTPALGTLLRRIHERCQIMAEYHGQGSAADSELWRDRYKQLSACGEAADLTHCNTRWIEVQSGSAVKHHWTPIGGFVGTAEWTGDLGHALPWLLWGELLHVGKNSTKGNGLIRVEAP
jgi:hypothetical protein